MDVLRVARINVLAESLTVSHPSITSRYCSIVVQLLMVSLRLETSRPVRRSVAFLEQELYRSILREQEELLDALEGTVTKRTTGGVVPKMAVELLSTQQEDVLVATLERSCRVPSDLYSEENKKYHRLYDHATVSRCQEALELRQGAAGGIVLAAARVILLEEESKQDKAVSNMLLLDETEINSNNNNGDLLRALQINPDMLNLESDNK